jgi:branched-chain amino acid transport system ATP-binding protein
LIVLEVRGLTKNFDGLLAVNDLSFTVNRGEVVGLIGPNGAGKTTVFSLVSGFLKPSTGSVKFEGKELTGLQPNKIAAMGLVRTFQLTNLAESRSVSENVLTAYHLSRRSHILGAVFRSPKARRVESDIRSKAMKSLVEFNMMDALGEPATSLPHGKQKALGILMALAANPRLLLLDEPTAGMSASETSEIMTLISRIRNDGMTVMLVEHDLRVVMGVCDRVIVLNFGCKISEGSPQEIAMDREVISAYLGFDNSEENTDEQ